MGNRLSKSITKLLSTGPEIRAAVKEIDGPSDYGDFDGRLDTTSFTMTRIKV